MFTWERKEWGQGEGHSPEYRDQRRVDPFGFCTIQPTLG